MREVISLTAIATGAAYLVVFAIAAYFALQSQMHWALAFIALALIVILRIWPALPVLAWLGAHYFWGWSWIWASLFVLPLCFYIASHYWTLASDLLHRPAQKQGA